MTQPEGRLPLNLTCVICKKQLGNYLAVGMQPDDGLAFTCRGHYGSTYFDPMDGTYLELSICDPCVKAAVDAGHCKHMRHITRYEVEEAPTNPTAGAS